MTLTGWNVFTQKDGNAPLLTGLSSTTKPAAPPDKWLLFETDTGKGYYSSGGAWVLATGGGGGTVTAVTASAPLASSGGATPDISLTVPSDATKFLDGTGTFDTVKDSDLSTSNITTNNVTIAKHGFAPILPNDATKYLDGTGAYTVPAGTGTGTVTTTGSPASGNLTKFSGATSITNADLTGDVTTSGTVAATIANDAVTYAKIQNAAANTFIARAANSSGDLSEVALATSQLAGRGSTGDVAAIVLGSGLAMSGTTLSAANTGGTWAQISRQVLGSDAATVTFSSISGAYNHLKLFITARDTVSATVTTMSLRFNNDSSAIYDYQIWYGVTGTAATDTASFAQTSGALAVIPGATSTRASSRGQIEVFIPDYATTTFEKSCFATNGSTAGASILYNLTSNIQWRNTAAITQIDLLATTNFKTGSIFTLYGIS